MVRTWTGGAVSLCRRRNKPKTGGGLCIVFQSTGTPCLFLIIVFFSLSGQSKLTAPGAQHKNTPEGVACSTRAEEPGSTSMGNGREKSSQGVLSKQGLKQAGLG